MDTGGGVLVASIGKFLDILKRCSP
jgi:hypothetical protein